MKKILFSLIALAGVFACNPVCLEDTLVPTNYTADQISDCITFQVYVDEELTQPAGPGEGNWVHYTTSPATQVAIITYKADGSEKVEATGPTGTFNLSPKRGSSNDQPVYVRVINSDNSEILVEKTVNVWVKGDLDPEIKILVSDSGTKKWKWYVINDECWGNMGNDIKNSGANFVNGNVDGKWWGCTPEGLLEQLQHSNTGTATGEEDSNAYMIFDEDGNIATYKADGTLIRKSSYELKNYDPTRGGDGSKWEIAKLVTNEPAILFPFEINGGGNAVCEFDVMEFTPDVMTLVYENAGTTAGNWGQMTWWRFINADDVTGTLTHNDKREWTWYAIGDACWGNMGNSLKNSGANFVNGNVDGYWWGCTPEGLLGQLQHSNTGTATGEEDSGAYMVFSNDGKISTCAADGTVIRSAEYEITDFDLTRGGDGTKWALGKLITTEPAILFPFEINGGGHAVCEFDIMELTPNVMTLVYENAGTESGDWAQMTWWRFKPKN